jgi:hypothetical protein
VSPISRNRFAHQFVVSNSARDDRGSNDYIDYENPVPGLDDEKGESFN